ncbi:hypothetical protein NLU13_2435 [Sarocladium strictum]|uniref:DUF6594 domain-containing protein n=1 Tax=Sarocladium strictum TaxID=5046 RepID=A0AA39LCP8_SARSR|nr:hypothetical protein NLU13_2435 [Sarocladium strictum]
MKEDVEQGLDHTPRSSNDPSTIESRTINISDAIDYNWDSLPPGTQQLGRWMHLGSNNELFRKFNYIGVRCLIHKAAKLQDLEVQLFEHDSADQRDEPRSPHHVSEYSARRDLLMARIEEAWRSHSEILILKERVDRIAAPTTKNKQDFQTFLTRYRPLDEKEEFMHDPADMVLLGGAREYTWMDGKIEYLAHHCPLQFVKKLLGEKKSCHPGQSHLSQNRINMLTKGVLILLVGSLLSAPLYPLFSWTQGANVDGTHMAMIMGLQTGCTTVFGVVLHLCTIAKRHEIFTASVAYMAILVVFMGQVRQG